MKRILAMILTAVILVSGFSGCAVSGTTRVSSNIRVTSSDAEEYAEWLTERLGVVNDSVVLGIGNNSTYGIDMSDFEDDGYLIRSIDGKVVLFGKTEDGLDFAVRKYANSVTLGETLEDVAYHEGYRIESFTLFDRDISEYTIVYPEEHNENMQLAVDDLQRLIEKACGASLPVVCGEFDAAPAIRLEYSYDEELKVGGYEYFERDGDLVISGAVREGSSNGVYRFLEKECGWTNLFFGTSDLRETDSLVIEKGLYGKEVPAFEWHTISANYSNIPYDNDRSPMSKAQQSYPQRHANHGMTYNVWADWQPNNYSGQICYTAETYLESTIDNISEYLKNQEENGAVVGETIRYIDISQGDSGTYCQCKDCTDIVSEEKAIIGPVVRWANTVADTINADYKGRELYFLIFAYYNAFSTPQVTMPNEWISVSYAPNGSCANHRVDGSECDPDTATDLGVSGVQFGRYLQDWCAISDNTYIWYYHIGVNFAYYNVWDVMYYDYQKLHELGIKGVYFYNYNRGMGLKSVEHLLAWSLVWDIDMTWDEYLELFHTYLEQEYGEGWRYIEEVLGMYEEATNDNCWHCWAYNERLYGIELYDLAYIEKNYEKMAELFESAILLAGSKKQQAMCEMLSVSLYYTGCYASFFKAHNEGNTEKLARLEADYQKVIDRFEKNGYSHDAIPNLIQFSIADTIWAEAENEWKDSRELLPSGDSEAVDYSLVDILNDDIEKFDSLETVEDAAEVSRLLETYSLLSLENKEKISDIDRITSSVGEAAQILGADRYKIKVMSFNVYYNKLTEERMNLVAERIRSESPDVVGIQEGTDEMCAALTEALGDEYEMLGSGRDKGGVGEKNNVLYKKSVFELLESGTVWLSDTPKKYSALDGSNLPRIMTYQKLKRKSDGRIFVHANTHLDLSSTSVRTEQVKIITKYLDKLYSQKYPIVITGDFNTTEGRQEFKTMLGMGYSVTNKFGESTETLQGFGNKSAIIDFTFVNSYFAVTSYKVCEPKINDEWVSDHNAIVSELILYPTSKSLGVE